MGPIINLNGRPYASPGLELDKDQPPQRAIGVFVWNAEVLELVPALSGETGAQLVARLSTAVNPGLLAPAILMEWLLNNESFIPRSWRERSILFVGTAYRAGSNGHPFFRYLFWRTDWVWDRVDNNWRTDWVWDWADNNGNIPLDERFAALVIRQPSAE